MLNATIFRIAVPVVFCFGFGTASAEEQVKVTFELSQSHFLSGDVAFVQAKIVNASEKDFTLASSWPSGLVDVQELSGNRLTGPSLSIGTHVDPKANVYVPPIQVKSGETKRLIAMFRVDVGTTRAHGLMGYRLVASIRLQDGMYQAQLAGPDGATAKIGRAFGEVFQLKTAGGIHRSHKLSESALLIQQLHGYRIHVESQQQWIDKSKQLLRDSRFPIANLERWTAIRGKLAKNSTLARLLDLSDQIVDLAADLEGRDLAEEVFRRSAACASEIERKWVIHRTYQYVRTNDEEAAGHLQRMAVDFKLWDCTVGQN